MKGKRMPRGIILFSAAIAGTMTGAIYMWSVFRNPLTELYQWDANQVTLAYSLFLLFACISSMISGFLQNKISPGMLVLISGAGYGLGWILTSGAETLWQLYLYFSVLGGFADGFIYNTAVATALSWYPDKKGFANGICIGAMGLSPLLFAPLGNYFIQHFGVQDSFRYCGYIIVISIAATFWMLKRPEYGEHEENERKEWNGAHEYTAGQMLRTLNFWVMWILFVVAASAGAMITGHASSIGEYQAKLTAGQASLSVGILAVGNFAGRLGFGSVSDKLGRTKSLCIALAITAANMLVFFKNADTFVSYMAVMSIMGACYGGIMTVMPSLCSDRFGVKNFGANYGILFTAFTCASFIGPMTAANIAGRGGSYESAYVIAGILAIAGLILLEAERRIGKSSAEGKLKNQ